MLVLLAGLALLAGPLPSETSAVANGSRASTVTCTDNPLRPITLDSHTATLDRLTAPLPYSVSTSERRSARSATGSFFICNHNLQSAVHSRRKCWSHSTTFTEPPGAWLGLSKRPPFPSRSTLRIPLRSRHQRTSSLFRASTHLLLHSCKLLCKPASNQAR